MTTAMELILATRNEGKLEELRALLKDMSVLVSSLKDYPHVPKIVEDGDTFLENARKKAHEVARHTGRFALADDSGLTVDALKGAPGVTSARFAGKGGDVAANNKKLLRVMKKVPADARKAAFVCVMVLAAPDGREWHVEGRCDGTIGFEPQGEGGFGYDPLFIVTKFGRTMAELALDEKNKISHRGRAMRHMREILEELLA